MLKPKKNITKKEIQKDPLLETIDQFQVKVSKNKKLFTNIILGVLAFVLLFSFLVRSDRINNNEADISLGIALISLDKGDFSTASFQFENIINDFESTTSAHLASYYLAKIKFNNNEMELAKKYIKSYLETKANSILLEAASILLADIHFKQDDLVSAIEVVDVSLKNCSNPFNCRSLKLKKAFFLVEQGNSEIANQILLEIKSHKNLEIGQKQQTEELMGRLAG